MLGGKVGRKLDEGGAEFVSEGQESIDEVVGRSVAVVEAAEVGDDLGKLGAKSESLGHRCCPFRHAVGGVDAVVRLYITLRQLMLLIRPTCVTKKISQLVNLLSYEFKP